MRTTTTRSALRAALVTGAALPLVLPVLGAPSAHANDLDVDPATASPGQTVTVSGGCRSGDRYVSISGAVATQGAVNDGWFSLQAKVGADKPGQYKITAKCITSNYSQDGALRVTERKQRERSDRKPAGWAATGGGGSQGPAVPWTPIGATLAGGAALVGGAALLRARARGRV